MSKVVVFMAQNILLQCDRPAGPHRFARRVQNLRDDHVVLERAQARGLQPPANHGDQI